MVVVALASMTMAQDGWRDRDGRKPPKTLYVWAGDQARTAPDFLAVIDFDEDSPRYGQVIRTVPVPGQGSAGNEPHHCHLSADKNTLACGGLLALLRGQNSIFFFDVSKARDPKFLFSTTGTLSNITDDFLPLKDGGFLVTQMGSHTGGTPGRVAEFDAGLRLVGEWPVDPPEHDFNPHGISARPELNLMVTSDFMMPASSLNVVPGDPLLRGIIRVWDFRHRSIVRTIEIPSALGTMDVKLIPGDRRVAHSRRGCSTAWSTSSTPRTARRRSSSTARTSCLTWRFRFAEA
jgi:selenium-binding protein 1